MLSRNRNVKQSKIGKIGTKRSIFPINYSRKMTLNASYITPIICRRIIPGQTLKLDLTNFIRLNTQRISPIDNLIVETFFFYGQDRITWDNYKKFMGEQEDPDNPQSYTKPQIEIPAASNTAGSLFNCLTASRIGKKVKMDAVPFVLHNMIYNRFFRDTDCMAMKKVDKTDSDKNIADYDIYRIHKTRDYFTNSTRDISNGIVTLPIGTQAPVVGNGTAIGLTNGGTNKMVLGNYFTEGGTGSTGLTAYNDSNTVPNQEGQDCGSNGINTTNKLIGLTKDPTRSGMIALLNDALGAELTAVRHAIMLEEYNEAVNRGGNRYYDLMETIYDVQIPNREQQEPIFLGSTWQPLFTDPIYQTSATDSTSPQGNITGNGVTTKKSTVLNLSADEFGYVIGYVVVHAIPQYQQGLKRWFLEKDEMDLFNPFFVNASDQAIKRGEIYLEDYDAVDSNGETLNNKVFGYIGKYDEYRYWENEIAGELNSEYTLTLDKWHYAEKFENAPENNESFMLDKTYEILDRSMAIINESEGVKAPQLIGDFVFSGVTALPIPTHAIPKISAYL